MNWNKSIKIIITSDTITLYWERPDDTFASDRYQLTVNGEIRENTSNTHFTIEGLNSDTEYSIKIDRMALGKAESFEAVIKTFKAKNRINITDAKYGAVGDGQVLNTSAIQKAIDDCGENEAVYIPKGIFLTGALTLHSNMELYLDEGAVLQGTTRVEDYLPKIKSRFEGTEMECYQSLLNLGSLDHNAGYNCENVIIRGKGTISGGGQPLGLNIIAAERERLKDYIEGLGDKVKEYENDNTIPGRARGRLIQICNAKHIIISGLHLQNGASWNVHMVYSDDILTNDCTFYSKGIWNGDGWDPDSSSNCVIFGCEFNKGDDAIDIKSGKNPEGNIVNRPCENILIFDNKCLFGHGVAIGSEMSGGVKNVKIWNFDLEHTMNGIEIKATKKRGGYVKNIEVYDCILPRIMAHCVGYNDDGIGAPKPPVFKDCRYENLTVTGMRLDEEHDVMLECKQIELCGFDELDYYLSDFKFKGIKFLNKENEKPARIEMKYCRGVSFENCSEGDGCF